ncbi:unnamed protein product, partial [Rotaria sp. Silwood2]
ELFLSIDTKQVNWCHCDTIVRDECDINHARFLISLDIIRRVLTDYFHNNVHYCMNLTDIDDEIIKKAREKHLIENYMNNTSMTIEKILEDCQLALQVRCKIEQ